MTDLAALDGASPHGEAGAVVGSEATWRDYVTLLKPRVMTLVVFSGLAGLMVAPGDLHPVLALTTILCIAVGAGAAGAVNMWFDRDIDAVMTRTRGRPLPQGRIPPEEALSFGVFLSVLPVVLMGIAVNWAAASILALASAFYIFVYTMWLKRRTPQNIVIGGAAGAFPPMIGWAAVTGDVTLASFMLFLLIFLWTPPHFWALALFRNEDYARAGVPMMPVVAGEARTKRQMMAYTLSLLPVGVAPWFLGVAGPIYAAGAVTLGALFVVSAWRVWQEDGAATGHKAAKAMFGYSILYLFAMFALLILDRTPGGISSGGMF